MRIKIGVIDSATDEVIDDSYSVDVSWASETKNNESLGEDIARTIRSAVRRYSLKTQCENCKAPAGINCYPDWGCTPEERVSWARQAGRL